MSGCIAQEIIVFTQRKQIKRKVTFNLPFYEEITDDQKLNAVFRLLFDQALHLQA